jgi:hypothetical protein
MLFSVEGYTESELSETGIPRYVMDKRYRHLCWQGTRAHLRMDFDCHFRPRYGVSDNNKFSLRRSDRSLFDLAHLLRTQLPKIIVTAPGLET